MTTIIKLLKILRPSLKAMILALVFTILTIAANIGLMATSAWLIAKAALHPPLSAIIVAVTGVRFFGISRAVLRYGERLVSHIAVFEILHALRSWLYMTLEPLNFRRIRGLKKSDAISAMANDIDTLQYFYLKAIAPPLAAGVILFGMLVFCTYFALPLAIWFMLTFLLGMLILPLTLYRLGQNPGKQIIIGKSEIKHHTIDLLYGLNELISFNAIDKAKQKILESSLKLNEEQTKMANRTSLAEALASFNMYLAVGGALAIAIYFRNINHYDPIYIAVITLAVMASFEAVLPLTATAIFMGESLAAARRIFSFETSKQVVEHDNHEVIDSYAIEFKDVTFAYSKQDFLLKNISFKVQEGQKIALVGPSGIGKSTLGMLLLKLEDYTEGCITIGCKDIQQLNDELLRSKIATVTQDIHIFNASFGDNIRLARPGASEEEIMNAIKKAELQEVVSNKGGLGTKIGLNGTCLSGGERQRLALARAFLKDAPIILLDEPTNGLDAITEQNIMTNIIGEAKTVLLITHRLTGLQTMDKILVLSEGQIKEQGTWQELMRQKGLFYKMWCLQMDNLIDV